MAAINNAAWEDHWTNNPRFKPTANKAAMVDKDYHWLDAKEVPPPRGPKMLMIDRRLGVAVLGAWRDSDGWTHWCPLPTFKEKT